MPGMKHPAHILPGIAYLDHKPYMYDLVCFWCIMHGSNIMPDDDTSHLLVLFLFLWRLRGGLEPAAISRFLMKFFHMIEYLQVSMSIMSKWTGRNLMILQKMISRFWWYSPSLMLELWVCPQASTFTLRQHRYWYRHQFGGTLQHRTTKTGIHCLCTMDIASWAIRWRSSV